MSLSIKTAARFVAIHSASVDVAPSRRHPPRKPRWLLTAGVVLAALYALACLARALT